MPYLWSFTIPASAAIGLWLGGPFAFLTPLLVFVAVPLLDIGFGRDDRNLDPAAEARAKSTRLYDWILYAYLPVSVALMLALGARLTFTEPTLLVRAGWILSVALSTGGIGITVAHELIHRRSAAEQWVGKGILMTVLYMHFAIEHVRGHHALVATEEDPATARKGESVYGFLLPSIFGQLVSAWHLETRRLSKQSLGTWSLRNGMIQFALIQGLWLAGLAALFGAAFLPAYLLTAFLAFSLLEVVNYIEHYGLERRRDGNGRYERVDEHHSWNSDHVVSRALLFELTRHADHHAHASRPYPILRSLEKGPQLPTGYPGMVLLALFPPLWFRVMDARLGREC
jgi:alkane 1-monooxygenase